MKTLPRTMSYDDGEGVQKGSIEVVFRVMALDTPWRINYDTGE